MVAKARSGHTGTMITAANPTDEVGRLRCLRSLEVLDTPPDPALDAITQALAGLLDCPIALVSLVDSDRQWFKSRHGLDTPETPGWSSFCAHAILDDAPLVVEDAMADARFADNPLVTGSLQLRFYAGQPLTLRGHRIGTLCVIDHRPRRFKPQHAAALRRLAQAVEVCLLRAQELRSLRLKEARLDDFLLASSEFAWECDARLRLTWVSRGIESVLSGPAAGWIGEPLWDGALTDTLGLPLLPSQSLAQTLSRATGPGRYTVDLAIGARRLVLQLTSKPVLDTAGRCIGWRGTGADCSAAVAAARQGRRQTEQLHQIARQVPGMIYQLEQLEDGRFRMPYASDGAKTLLGLTADDLVRESLTLVDRVHRADQRRLLDEVRTSARDLSIWSGLFRVVLPGRGTRWLEGRATPERTEHGTVLWHGFMADVTARCVTEQQLSLTRQRLNLAMAISGLGVVQIDLDAGTVVLDDVAAHDHGQEATRQPCALLHWLAQIDDQDHPAVRQALALSSQCAGERVRVVYTLRGAQSGRRIEMQLDRQQPSSALMAVCRDITVFERADQLQREAAAADARRQEHNAFLSRVSHELRTPMNAIIGFTYLLLSDSRSALADHQRRWLDHVQKGGQHLLSLIDDVLVLSRTTEAPQSLQQLPVDLGQTLGDCLAMLQPLAEQAGVRLMPPALPSACWALADARGLRQALTNVLANAVKYNQRGGGVFCVVRREGLNWLLQVRDEGPGIAAEKMARLFMPFERLGAETGAVTGTGLGLAIAKQLIDAMGGTVQAECPATGGMQITIGLPAAPPPQTLPLLPQFELAPNIPPPSAAPASPARNEKRRWKALYVEDDPVNALLMCSIFEQRSEWKLQVLGEPQRLMPALQQGLPDLLLLDLHLPGSTGFELLELVRAEPSLAGTRCIAVSADAMPATQEAARRAGFDGFWTKPLDLPRLLSDLDAVALPRDGLAAA